MPEIPIQAIHFFSQLSYLDTAPVMSENGKTTVDGLCEYYLKSPVGVLYMKNRFGDIVREYEQWLEMLENGSRTYRGWEISGVFDDNKPSQSGFYGCTYVSPQGDRVVAFRGSELLGNHYYRNDYVTNFGLAYMLKTPQQSRVDDYWARFGSGFSGDFALTGHSLGGNLAVYGMISAPKEVKEKTSVCAAFNAPGFNKEFILKHKSGIDGSAARIRLIQNECDPVSSLFDNVVEPEIIKSKFIPSQLKNPTPQDIFYPHSNFMYEIDDEGGFVSSEDNKVCRFCHMAHILSDMLQRLPVKVREGLAETLLTALYAAPSPEQANRYMLDAAIKYIAQNAQAVNGEYAEIMYAARLLEGLGDIPRLYKNIVIGEGAQNGASALIILLKIASQIFI